MPPLDPRELLSQTQWLRQLARSLVKEGADDLVQEAWVAALRSPPRGDRGLRPWLRKVVTNAARFRWRGDTNRAAREETAAELDDRAVPSPDELLERHELQQLLAQLVSELDEPFRSTILLRFAEGLTPAEIADRLSIPGGTVRWRLKEGLERLRVQLDAAYKGDRRAWLAALAPLAMPRTSPASPAIPLALVFATLCAVAVGVLTLIVSAPSGNGPAPRSRTASNSQRAPHAVASAATKPELALAWLSQQGVAPRQLTGRVVMNGSPVRGATVRLVADPLPGRELVTDADGRFDFGEQMPREYVIGASMPGVLGAILRIDLRKPSALHDLELVLQDCTASIYGRVVDAAGTAIAGAHVTREGVLGTESDRNGNYALCVLPTAALVAEIRIVAQADGFGTLTTVLAPPGRMRHDFVLAPEATVSGRVLASGGTPVANARVAIDVTGPDASKPPERGVALTSISDDAGRFHIAGLATGEYTISATSADGSTQPVPFTLQAAENRTLELHSVSTGIVRGRVLSKGAPVAGVTVAAGQQTAVSQADGSFVLARVPIGDIVLETTPFKNTSGATHVVEGDHNAVELLVEPMGTFRGTVTRHGTPVPFARVDVAGPSRAGVTADAAGRYEAAGLEAGKYGFYCDDRKRGAMYTEDRDIELGPGETREHNIELSWGASISGRVVNNRGEPVPSVTVAFRGEMSSECLTDETGAFTCGALAGGSYEASVHPTSSAAHRFRFIDTPAKFELRDGDARIDNAQLVVDSEAYSITGVVTDRSGAPVLDATVRAFAIDLARRTGFRGDLSAVTDEQGRFKIGDLSSGDYYVEVESGGLATRQTVSAGSTNVSLILDRAPCEGSQPHDVPPSLTRPPSRVVWNQQLELIGWSLPSTASAGRPIELTIVYRAAQPVDRDWRIFAHFDSPATRVNADHEPAIGWCPTSQWKRGQTIVDHVVVQFEQPGRYSLEIGFFTGNAPNWENLTVSAAPASMTKQSHDGVRVGDIAIQ
jgi:RNA polymerase sigma factor (sigma-70 family)